MQTSDQHPRGTAPGSAAGVAFAGYALGIMAFAISTFSFDWSTSDSRLLVVLGLIVPIAFAGILTFIVARHLGYAAVATVAGCAAGHLYGLFCGFSYFDPVVTTFAAGFFGTVFGLLIFGTTPRNLPPSAPSNSLGGKDQETISTREIHSNNESESG